MNHNLTLDQKLQYIGVQLALLKKNPKSEWVDLENTIHEASLEIAKDSRLFSLLASWISVHGDYVIIEKLMKLQKNNNSPWLVALAISAYNLGFHQWGRLIKKQKSEFALVDLELAKSSIALKGEEAAFKKYGFFIPKGTIRIRAKDVRTIEQLIKDNPQYKNRLMYGASWRSDIITAIQLGIKTPYQIAKTLGCSYEPALRIFKEYQLVMGE
ncbi:MAG: hypothetical protein NDI63_02925 [Pseudobdellovibrio sp.]|nr:hypothetical protein [Pseudobdellovibrio sp.]